MVGRGVGERLQQMTDARDTSCVMLQFEVRLAHWPVTEVHPTGVPGPT